MVEGHNSQLGDYHLGVGSLGVGSCLVHVTAIIAAGGRGTRFGGAVPKQLLPLGGRPILERSVDAFVRHPRVTDVVVALPAELIADPPAYLRSSAKPIALVEGGARRQDSVARAFARVPAAAEVVVVHDAARPLVSETLIARTLDAAVADGAAIAALAATDTVKRGNEQRLIVGTVPRGEIFLAQTPQAFRTSVLRDALTRGRGAPDATDEAALVERAGHPVRLVEGDPRNVKITTADDVALAERLLAPASMLRIGTGYDLHRLIAGRRLILGGVVIPFDKGLAGHSDADAVCHAVTDAILGAVAAGDIGRHFPDSDARWKDADSLALLARAAEVVAGAGYAVGNVDVVVIAERPKLAPYVDAMRANLAQALGITPAQVSVKGKTNEGVGSIGAGESIAVHAVALVAKNA
ncbi:MAG: 2-C-methyl-D-erythritol 2,4-cyclodiphosphate synthase [Acidobacteria bacterium]|nr:2-C-methyl-D-erythritol 2,4-cyclodiphosphate synthase [Acidobacteriota bacterium]